MKRLIVHADDMGADDARNAGIIEAIEAGSVTAVSILVNGPAFQDCLQKIASMNGKQLSFGVHLNLTEGRPLSLGLKIITGADGFFCGKQEGHRRLMNRGDEALENDILREFAAQIRVLHDAGIRIDHLDGHQHVQIFPAAIDAAIRTAKEFGIPWIRLPQEPLPTRSMDRNNRMLNDEAARFCRLAAAVRTKLHDASMKTTDHFRGLYLKGRLSLARLGRTLQTLPPGLTELMVHPGRASVGPEGPFSAFSNREREKELTVLTSGSFHRMLEKCHVRLTPFPETCP